MNRKDFLISVWRKGIKPILLVGIIFFCVNFIFNVFNESGTERFATILILGFGLLILSIYLTNLFFTSLSEKINSLLPEQVKLWIRVIGKIIDYISPIILGLMIYHFWKKDWVIPAIVLGVLLLERIAEIIKDEKKATTQSKLN